MGIYIYLQDFLTFPVEATSCGSEHVTEKVQIVNCTVKGVMGQVYLLMCEIFFCWFLLPKYMGIYIQASFTFQVEVISCG